MKLPAAIHLLRSCKWWFTIKVRDGDIIRVNGKTGELTLLVDELTLNAHEMKFLI